MSKVSQMLESAEQGDFKAAAEMTPIPDAMLRCT